MHPRIEFLGLAQARQLLPRSDEGLLHRVLGQLNVTEDQPSDRIQPVGASDRQRLKSAVITALGRLDQCSGQLFLSVCDRAIAVAT